MSSDQPRNPVATGHPEQGASLTGWRGDMENAPASRALLYAPPEKLFDDPDGRDGEIRIARPQDFTWATHWMPLPPPPENPQ